MAGNLRLRVQTPYWIRVEVSYPTIIQGGMGVAVSGWPLARAVSQAGQLGVVSGTGLDAVLVRRLQLGDIGGHLREAFDHFPLPEIANRIWDAYFVPGGLALGSKFKSRPIPKLPLPKLLLDLTVVANFVEVFLAKRGHDGLVGINLLEKIQLMTLPSLFGAMLARVDYVLMGAGIPRQIPGILDRFAAGEEAEQKLDVAGAPEDFVARFSPSDYGISRLHRPAFLAIVSSATLAQSLARKSAGVVNGFVVEHNSAGGHNAPPRGAMQLDSFGQPLYGPRDEADWAAFRGLGLPFWIAGSAGSAEALLQAKTLGAQGIQVGTAFAFCQESGIDPDIKRAVVRKALRGETSIHTDPLASPTGFPFKVLAMEGSVSEPAVYEARERICDLGYLRQLYRDDEGRVAYRCAAEPVADFVAKGGSEVDAEGRKCLCNGLLATVGLGQRRSPEVAEPPLVTAGDDLVNLRRFVREGEGYAAADVLRVLLDVKP